MLNFDFSEKGLELVSLPNFLYDFSRIAFLMFWLPLLLEILGNVY